MFTTCLNIKMDSTNQVDLHQQKSTSYDFLNSAINEVAPLHLIFKNAFYHWDDILKHLQALSLLYSDQRMTYVKRTLSNSLNSAIRTYINDPTRFELFSKDFLKTGGKK